MGKTCHVKNCASENQELSFFSVPNNLEIRKKWSDILQCSFNSENVYVCEKHFCSDDISAHLVSNNFRAKNQNGETVCTYLSILKIF